MTEGAKVDADSGGEAWLDGGEYSFKLVDGEIIARNASGRILKTVPAKAKKLAQFEQLEGLRVFLAQHEQQCVEFVRRWFLHGLPVPLSVLIAVWPDPAWRGFLHDVVVTDGQVTGLLRDADADGIQLVDLDGESITIAYSDEATVLIQHPAVMADLEDWREFAVELGVHQGLDQLFRDVYPKPADSDGQQAAVRAYSEATYERAGHLIGRARGGGFNANLGEVRVDVQEDGKTVSAQLDIDAWDSADAATLGTLSFFHDGKGIPLADVGPVAWSEGIRMCEFVYAGRTIKKEEN